jgi:hypothetical protein
MQGAQTANAVLRAELQDFFISLGVVVLFWIARPDAAEFSEHTDMDY